MTTFRTYSKTDIIEGETTLSAARKTNARFSDILSWFPTTVGAAQHMALTFASGLTTFVYTHILRSNVALEHDDGVGVQYQALVSDGDNTTSWNHVFRSNTDFVFDGSAPSSGQLLRFDGDGTVSAVSISAYTFPEVKTNDFTTAANGQFIVSTGVSEITLHSPGSIGEQFSIMPNIGTVDFVTDGIDLAGAMQVNGATLDTGYLDQNVRYNFISFDGTNWWVSGEVFDV